MDFTRREVLATAALIPVAAIKAAPQSAPAQVTTLDAAQRAILNAFVDRIVPRDELGAGALDAGAADYIDIQLGGYLSGEKASILEGLAALDTFAKSSQGANFADLSNEKRDAVLTAIDAGQAPNLRAFFTRARRLTLEGMFADPYYGGNKNFVGWDLIRYPGPRPAVGPEDQRMGVEIKPYHRSAWGAEHNH